MDMGWGDGGHCGFEGPVIKQQVSNLALISIFNYEVILVGYGLGEDGLVGG